MIVAECHTVEEPPTTWTRPGCDGLYNCKVLYIFNWWFLQLLDAIVSVASNMDTSKSKTLCRKVGHLDRP